MDLSGIKSILPKIVNKLLRDKNINIYNVIRVACAAVEQYSSSSRLGSREKLTAAVHTIKLVIETAKGLDLIDDTDVAKLLKFCSEDRMDELTQLIIVMVDIANDPNIIAYEKWKERVSTCWFGCCRKC